MNGKSKVKSFIIFSYPQSVADYGLAVMEHADNEVAVILVRYDLIFFPNYIRENSKWYQLIVFFLKCLFFLKKSFEKDIFYQFCQTDVLILPISPGFFSNKQFRFSIFFFYFVFVGGHNADVRRHFVHLRGPPAHKENRAREGDGRQGNWNWCKAMCFPQKKISVKSRINMYLVLITTKYIWEMCFFAGIHEDDGLARIR